MTRSLASRVRRGIPRLSHLFNSSLQQTLQHIYHDSFYPFYHSHSHQLPLLRPSLAACRALSPQKLFYLPLGPSMTLQPVVCHSLSCQALFYFRFATLVAHPSRPSLQQPIYPPLRLLWPIYDATPFAVCHSPLITNDPASYSTSMPLRLAACG